MKYFGRFTADGIGNIPGIINKWQAALATDGWNSLYLSNHDLPRLVSHYADDQLYRARSAKLLAAVTCLMKGTPFTFRVKSSG